MESQGQAVGLGFLYRGSWPLPELYENCCRPGSLRAGALVCSGFVDSSVLLTLCTWDMISLSYWDASTTGLRPSRPAQYNGITLRSSTPVPLVWRSWALILDLGGGADTLLPPRAGSRSHLSSSEHAPGAQSHLMGGSDTTGSYGQGVIREDSTEEAASGLAQK